MCIVLDLCIQHHVYLPKVQEEMKYLEVPVEHVAACCWHRNREFQCKLDRIAVLSEALHKSDVNTWWRHQMEAFSALLAICAGSSPGPGEFHAQRPVTRSFDVFFDLSLNKRLSKQWRGWWFETQSRPLWRHCNDCARMHQAQQSRYISNGKQQFWIMINVVWYSGWGTVYGFSRRNKISPPPPPPHFRYVENLRAPRFTSSQKLLKSPLEHMDFSNDSSSYVRSSLSSTAHRRVFNRNAACVEHFINTLFSIVWIYHVLTYPSNKSDYYPLSFLGEYDFMNIKLDHTHYTVLWDRGLVVYKYGGSHAQFMNVAFRAGQATSHYLNQWWLVYWRIYASLGLN